MSDLGIFLSLMWAIGVSVALRELWAMLRRNEDDIESNELRIIALETALADREEWPDE